jgi:hypothetical protein
MHHLSSAHVTDTWLVESTDRHTHLGSTARQSPSGLEQR